MSEARNQVVYPKPSAVSELAKHISREIVVLAEPLSRAADVIRGVQGRLQRQFLDQGIRSFALVGDAPNRGTSYIAANLAVSYAQTGSRTALVDANLNDPRQAELFCLPHQRVGLSDWLAYDQVASDGGGYGLAPLPNLTVVPAGQRSAAGDLLQHPNLISIMAQLNRIFDVVIYDAPPATDLANCIAVAAGAERTIIVGRMQETAIQTVRQLQSLVKQCHGEIGGVILSRF
jgi:Mrp family chromosome partitioning ATPase